MQFFREDRVSRKYHVVVQESLVIEIQWQYFYAGIDEDFQRRRLFSEFRSPLRD